MKVSDLARPENRNRLIGAENWISREQSRHLGARIVPSGATIFPKVGAALMGNARGHTQVPVAIDNNMMAVVPTSLHDRYTYWWLRSVDMARLSDGGTLPFISDTSVRDLRVPSLPPDEQRGIADFLDDRVARIEQIITARRNQVVLLQESAGAAIVQTLLGHDFRPLGGEPWFNARAGSRAVRLSSLWTVVDCKHRTPQYLDVGYPVISPGDISPGRLDLSRATRFVGRDDYLDLADDLRRCRTGDIVYSRNASAGTAAYVDTTEPFTMGQDVCRITSPKEDQLYLAYCLNYLTFPQLESARVGSTFTRINVERIKGLSIPYRHPPQQRELATRCDQALLEHVRITSSINRSLELLSEYKQSLITAAVSGELDVSTAGSGIPG